MGHFGRQTPLRGFVRLREGVAGIDRAVETAEEAFRNAQKWAKEDKLDSKKIFSFYT